MIAATGHHTLADLRAETDPTAAITAVWVAAGDGEES